MNSEIEIHGSLFGISLEKLNDCIQGLFTEDLYEYRHLDEINVEDDNLEFWFREDDTLVNDSALVLLNGTFSGSYEDLLILINKIITSLGIEKNAKYQFDLIKLDKYGNEIGEMFSLSSI
jgi:hypothetical protein